LPSHISLVLGSGSVPPFAWGPDQVFRLGVVIMTVPRCVQRQASIVLHGSR
jgi:hypothetical protein